jgi:hypothetical protein
MKNDRLSSHGLVHIHRDFEVVHAIILERGRGSGIFFMTRCKMVRSGAILGFHIT